MQRSKEEIEDFAIQSAKTIGFFAIIAIALAIFFVLRN